MAVLGRKQVKAIAKVEAALARLSKIFAQA